MIWQPVTKGGIINLPFPDSTYKLLYSGSGYHNKASFFRKAKNIIGTEVTDSLELLNLIKQELLDLPKLIATILLLVGNYFFLLSSMLLDFPSGKFFVCFLSIIPHSQILGECWNVCPSLKKIQISQPISCECRFRELKVALTVEKSQTFCESPWWFL